MTESRPLVSVVVIFLDEARYLTDAVESVRAQTYTNWELLLVDDGSTDGSSRLAREFAASDPARIRYLEHPGHANRGMSATRNLGLREARGRYVALLDADDVWLPTKLAEQVAMLEAHPAAAMTYGPSEWWSSWDGAGGDDHARLDVVRPLRIETGSLVRPPSLLTRYLRRQTETPCPSSVMVRREAALAVGGFEESFRGEAQLYEDQAFFAKIHAAQPVVVDDRCRTRYRQRPDSCVATVKGARRDLDVRRRFLIWLDSYLRRTGARDRTLWLAVRLASWQAQNPGAHRMAQHGASVARKAVAALLPAAGRRALAGAPSLLTRVLQVRERPPVGTVQFGHLRRITPISRSFGYDRGTPIDRHYIEQFLAANAHAIRGRVLEVGDSSYTHRFGGSAVTQAEVLHVHEGNPIATYVADLADGAGLPSETFDCIVLTQTLHLVFDLRAAVRTLYRMLKPGGVLLATFPGISQVCDDEWAATWYWSLTRRAALRLFALQFPADQVKIEAFGNVLTASAFLYGLAAEELRPGELLASDPAYEMLIAVRAERPGATS